MHVVRKDFDLGRAHTDLFLCRSTRRLQGLPGKDFLAISVGRVFFRRAFCHNLSPLSAHRPRFLHCHSFSTFHPMYPDGHNYLRYKAQDNSRSTGLHFHRRYVHPHVHRHRRASIYHPERYASSLRSDFGFALRPALVHFARRVDGPRRFKADPRYRLDARPVVWLDGSDFGFLDRRSGQHHLYGGSSIARSSTACKSHSGRISYSASIWSWSQDGRYSVIFEFMFLNKQSQGLLPALPSSNSS